MSTPRTELDPRFSDPNAVASTWDETRAALAAAQLSWISTVRADGRPHVTPLVTVWLDDALYFCTGPDEQKARNLDANPQVVVTTGCATWDDGVDVVVEGRAERVRDQALLERLASEWSQKWDGESWQFTAATDGFTHEQGGLAHVHRVVPRKVLAFGKGTSSHTRHVFA